MTGIYQVAMAHAKLGITKDIMATKVLPFLIPLSIDNNINLSQVSHYSGILHNIQILSWVLVKVRRGQTHKAAQRVSRWQIGGTLSIGELSGYNTETLTVDHSG